jgi:hypothetical protein
MFAVQLISDTRQLLRALRNRLFKAALRLSALGEFCLKLLCCGFCGQPSLFPFFFGIRALGSTFGLQLFNGRFSRHPGLFQALFGLFVYGKFSLQQFVGHLYRYPGLRQLLQGLIVRGAFRLQQNGDILTCQSACNNDLLKALFRLLTLSELRLKLFSSGFSGQPCLFQSLFGLCAPGEFTLQLLVNGCELCAFGGKFSLQQLNGGFTLRLFCGTLRLQLFNKRFSSAPRLFQALFRLLTLSELRLKLFMGGFGGQPRLFQSLFGLCAPGKFTLQLLMNGCELCAFGRKLRLQLFNGGFTLCLFLSTLGLQLFNKRFSGALRLFQVLFRLHVRGAFGRKLSLHLFQNGLSGEPCLFQSALQMLALCAFSL